MNKHLGLPRIAECSMHPKYKCNECGKELWSERSVRSGGKEWLSTKDGKRHYKTQCKTVPFKKSIDGKLLTLLILSLIFLSGCQGFRDTALNLSLEDAENVKTAREISVTYLGLWPYQSGFFRGALGDRINELPSHVLTAWDELDALAQKDDITDEELGRSLGLRVRMICESVKKVLEMYFPNALDLMPLL